VPKTQHWWPLPLLLFMRLVIQTKATLISTFFGALAAVTRLTVHLIAVSGHHRRRRTPGERAPRQLARRDGAEGEKENTSMVCDSVMLRIPSGDSKHRPFVVDYGAMAGASDADWAAVMPCRDMYT